MDVVAEARGSAARPDAAFSPTHGNADLHFVSSRDRAAPFAPTRRLAVAALLRVSACLLLFVAVGIALYLARSPWLKNLGLDIGDLPEQLRQLQAAEQEMAHTAVALEQVAADGRARDKVALELIAGRL